MLEDIHLELYQLLGQSDSYLRSLINCTSAEPALRPGESEPMYHERLSCREIREFLQRDISEKVAKMRMNLALSSPYKNIQSDKVESKTSQLSYEYRINPYPAHRYAGLEKLDPLSSEEIAVADKIWKDVTPSLLEDYDEKSGLETRLDSLGVNATDREMNHFERGETTNRLIYQIRKRSEWRASQFEAYQASLKAMPLAGYFSNSQVTTEGLHQGLLRQLRANCLVRMMKYSWFLREDGRDRRRGAEVQCARYALNIKASANDFTRSDELAAGLLAKMNWRFPLRATSTRHEQISIFGVHPEYIKSFRKRYTGNENARQLAELDQMKAEYESDEFWGSVREMSGFVALGVACTIGLKRVPGIGAVLQRFGMPICLFSMGLPLNAMVWFAGSETYQQRLNEFFAMAPNRELIQQLKTLDDEQTNQVLNTIFLGIGTGLPEMSRAFLPWLKLSKFLKR